MPLISVLSDEVRPDRLRKYEQLVASLAERAREKDDPWKWTAHQTVVGQRLGTVHYVTSNASFAEIATRGMPDQLITRLLGEKKGGEFLEQAGECILQQQQQVSIDRPDLSHPSIDDGRTAPAAVVTVARARPGHQDACEELIRKVAEAIPKVDDPTRLISYQTVLGDLAQYWTVRPLAGLDELDRSLPVPELLNQAFGAAEGGLIFRSGLEAIEQVMRSVVMYREELSNPE